jgi:hypothetical protein
MPDIFDLLRIASAERATKTVQPLRDAFQRVRGYLDGYEKAAETVALGESVQTMLISVGQPPPSIPERQALPTAELVDALRQALLLVETWQIPQEPAPAPVPEEAPPPVVVVAEAPKDTPFRQLIEAKPIPTVPAETLAKVFAIADEVARLRVDFQTEHPIRLGFLLQALVAEARTLLDRVPTGTPASTQVSRVISMIGYMRGEGRVDGFIKGLAREHRYDWPQIAFEARRKLSRYDADALSTPKGTTEKKLKASVPEPLTDVVENTLPEMELPNLQAKLEKDGTLLIVGGEHFKRMPLVTARYGVKAEWVQSGGDNPQKIRSLCQRIKAGGVVAVIALEGRMAHKGWISVSDACSSSGIPIVEGGKGGIGAVGQALVEVERKLATAS